MEIVKITALETVNVESSPNITFVHVHTDEGLIGLGDTFYGPASIQTYVHDLAAPLLLGKDPLAIEQLFGFGVYVGKVPFLVQGKKGVSRILKDVRHGAG